jgi:hypothetical protein
MVLDLGLQDILKAVELNGEVPSVMYQRWVLRTKDAGLTCIGSDYFLLPVELSKYIRDELKINIKDPDAVDVTCSVSAEKGDGLYGLRIIYDIKPHANWRFKP